MIFDLQKKIRLKRQGRYGELGTMPLLMAKLGGKPTNFTGKSYLNRAKAWCPFHQEILDCRSGTRLGAVLAAQFDAISREQWCDR